MAHIAGMLGRRLLVGACSVLAAVAAVIPTAALSSVALSDQHHKAWSYAEGAPADVWALGQGSDGYLWLGTGSGLHRFDGERFEPVPLAVGQSLPSKNITALTLTPDGGAWIGFYAAGVARLQNGHVQHHGLSSGVPEGMVYRIVQDGDGTTWAAIDGGLSRYRDGRWETMTARDGYPWTHADWLLLDRDGTLWVSTGASIAYLLRGETAFRASGESSSLHAVLAEAPDGTIWVSDDRGTRPLMRDGIPAHTALPDLVAKRLLFHRDGTLWGTDAKGGGLFRVWLPDATGTPVIERFGPNDGLSAPVAVPVLFDREDNLWVGTNLGLDRFRRTAVTTVSEVAQSAPAGYGLAVGQGMTVVASGGALHDLDEHGARVRLAGLPRITAAHADVHGTVWLIGAEKLLRVRDRSVEDVPLPGARRGRDIRAIASDAKGLWVSILHAGLFRFEQEQWIPQSLSDARVPDAIAAAPSGVWLGFAENRLEWREGGRVRTFSRADGIDVGNVTAIHAEGADIYVAGENGLAWRSTGPFHTLSNDRHPALNGISGMTTVDNVLWLNGHRGVARVSRDALTRPVGSNGLDPEITVLDALDGVPGIALQSSPVSTLQRGTGHKLWLATNQGVAWLETNRLRTNRHPPHVAIRSVVADGQTFDATRSFQLPTGIRSLRLHYTATSLTLPERVTFRYRLEGVDPDWVDAGTRREAIYNRPPPGDYRFRVDASNEHGVPSLESATLTLSLPPLFYQTRWFVVLCVGVAAGTFWFVYMLRLKELGTHIRSRLHERHLERERIARELHDTLLQSIQGLILRFQAAADRLPRGNDAREEMERALDRADQVLAEGRSRVVDIRAATTDGDDLSEAFSKVADELSTEHRAEFKLATLGPARPLDPIVQDELFRIGREALVNAYRHADASTIEVHIEHGREQLRLRIADDGRGIDSAVLECGRPGHWGLVGMRERAERINATLYVRSQQSAGTEVDVVLSAGAAYRPCLEKSRWSLLRRLFHLDATP